MTYACRIERDSISPLGDRLTTFVVTFPRVALAEVFTHRVVSTSHGYEEVAYCDRTTTPDISKNSASSRAIPFARMVRGVIGDPYMPEWTENQAGMQGKGMLELDSQWRRSDQTWRSAMEVMVGHAQTLHTDGIHKQDCNRLLEPWAWVTQVMTATQWDNFFALRCHHMAFPPFRRIARMMFLARRESVPTQLDYDQWHLPFVPLAEQMAFHMAPGAIVAARDARMVFPPLVRQSVARCAWVSYENHDKDATQEAVDRTFDRLCNDDIAHMSPFESQATPMRPGLARERQELRSNLNGWLQARKLISTECVRNYAPSDEEVASWGITDWRTGL